MSHLEVAERIIPGNTNANYYTLHPSDLHCNNCNDPTTLKEHDRQDQDEEARKENPQPRPKKRGYRHWARRILVGKEWDEEIYEQQHHKRLNWFKNEVRRHVAEFVGTFFLILIICGIQVNQGLYPDGGVANIDKGIASGFVLIGLIFSFGRVSGAHFNPCVTLAFFLRGSFKFLRFITYISFQFAGAVSGAAVLYGLFGNIDHLGATTPGAGLKNTQAFGVEIIMTFLLITVVLTAAENAKILSVTAGLTVGLTFAAIETWAWNFSGASVNPWRSIAPTIIADYGWHTYWIYIIGPLIGTVVAVILQRILVSGVARHETKCACKGYGKISNIVD